MTKRILSIFLLVAIATLAFISCKKYSTPDADATRNYFPLTFGRSVTFAVDSIYYNEVTCIQRRVKSQLKYVVTDTFSDRKNFSNKLSYILDVFSRPYDGGVWKPISVIILNPTATGLNWTQDNVKYTKLVFPIQDGFSWKGNENAPVNDADFAFLKDWNYQYRDFRKSYNTGFVNFDNTVTVLENDESVNYPAVDSGVAAMRTFSKTVYAYNVGLVYRELTHWTYRANNSQCLNGYSVVMQAIDHN
ncbi:MAG: hypothetical protein K9G49_16630 [Taibaiella sp.]|nr:hypothetical protein [Taibaiella sp.]